VTIKESSDELNPPVTTPVSSVAPPKTGRSAGDLLGLAISTCGVGYLPLAPGTFGSVVGVAVSLLLQLLVIQIYAEPNAVVIVSPMVMAAFHVPAILLITFLGIWAASRTESVLGAKDPGKVVVDEVAGQMISLLPVVLVHDWPGFRWVIVSFILFRFFDIVKPYPARRFERLHGGLGIMADDLVAGVYAAIVTTVLMGLFGKLTYLVSVIEVM
jgi:phosphatidylglycerophosphatase A